ncbi:MAG: thioredoxin fold domain-containing protein [Methylococcaceae bacterium]
MIKKLGVLIVLMGIVGQSQAVDSDPAAQSTKPRTDGEMTAEVKDIMRSVDEVKRLPVTGLSMIKAGDKTFLISDNGHFVVAGNFKLVDMWQGKIIGSVGDTKGIDKVDLRKIGLNPDELSTFSIGTGKKEVVIFVDPQCNYCHDLIGQLEPLGKEYVFKLVLIPVLGKESAEISKKLICNKDKAQSLKALIAKDYSKLPALIRQEGACDLKPLQKAVVATKLLDIQGVPFIFLPSHNTFRGGAKSFKPLLEKDLEDEINGR